MMTTTTTRAFDVPAYLLATTGTPFQGRVVPTDRRSTLLEGRTASVVGLRTQAGVGFDATTIPRGTSMI